VLRKGPSNDLHQGVYLPVSSTFSVLNSIHCIPNPTSSTAPFATNFKAGATMRTKKPKFYDEYGALLPPEVTVECVETSLCARYCANTILDFSTSFHFISFHFTAPHPHLISPNLPHITTTSPQLIFLNPTPHLLHTFQAWPTDSDAFKQILKKKLKKEAANKKRVDGEPSLDEAVDDESTVVSSIIAPVGGGSVDSEGDESAEESDDEDEIQEAKENTNEFSTLRDDLTENR
jgi:hypothetical protein